LLFSNETFSHLQQLNYFDQSFLRVTFFTGDILDHQITNVKSKKHSGSSISKRINKSKTIDKNISWLVIWYVKFISDFWQVLETRTTWLKLLVPCLISSLGINEDTNLGKHAFSASTV
jgi:hypothetical protein